MPRPTLCAQMRFGQGRSFEQRAVNASIAGIGTSQYPLNVALVAEGTRDIDAAVREWTETIGEQFSEDDGGLQAPSCKQCADKYGFGHCVDDFSAVEVASFSGLEGAFCRDVAPTWSSHWRTDGSQFVQYHMGSATRRSC